MNTQNPNPLFVKRPLDVQEAAEILSAALETRTRDNGEKFTALREDLPEDLRKTLQDVIHAAHGDMMPDDFRYRMIDEVASALSEVHDPDEADLDSLIDVHTSDLTAWLHSRNDRVAYCDEAREEFGEASSTSNLLQLGQYSELCEIRGLLVPALEDWVESFEDEDEDFSENRLMLEDVEEN